MNYTKIQEVINKVPTEEIIYGNLRVHSEPDLIKTNYYDLMTQRGNSILRTAFPGVIKSFLVTGSQHNIASFYYADSYGGSLKMRHKVTTNEDCEQQKYDMLVDLDKIESLAPGNNWMLFMKGILPILKHGGPLAPTDATYQMLATVMQSVKEIVVSNSDKGQSISDWLDKIMGDNIKDMLANLEEEMPDKILYLTALIVELVGRIAVLNSSEQEKPDIVVTKFKNPNPPKYDDFTLRYYYIDKKGRLNFTYIL